MTTPLPALPDTLPAEPLTLLGEWLEAGRTHSTAPDPWVMSLATIDADGRPSARMVLCRLYERESGVIAFYTNRESRKGLALAAHPVAAAVFHWADLERQVRVEGPVTESSAEESDAYFARRQRLSQLAAWASDQSRPLASRAEFERRLAEVTERFADVESIPRPPHWGGYRIAADHVELWTQLAGRTHDRAVWTRTGEGWSGTRQHP